MSADIESPTDSGNISKTELLRRSGAVANLFTATKRVHASQVRAAEDLVSFLQKAGEALGDLLTDAKTSLDELTKVKQDLVEDGKHLDSLECPERVMEALTDLPSPQAIVINGELAEQHANLLQGIYDLNKKALPVGGLFLENMLDVIRSLRGITTREELFAQAWQGHDELSGDLYQRWLAGVTPSGTPLVVPTGR